IIAPHRLPSASRTAEDGSGDPNGFGSAPISLVADAVNGCRMLPPPNTKDPVVPPDKILLKEIEKLMEFETRYPAKLPPTTVPLVTLMIAPVGEFRVPVSRVELVVKSTSSSLTFALS